MAQTNITLTDGQRVTLTWLAILGAFFFLLWLLGNVITPFVVAAVLAYVLDPLVNLVQRKTNYRIGRAAASAMVIILLALVLTAIGLLITPILLDDIPKIQRKIPQLLDQINAVISPLLDRFGIPFKLEVDTIKSIISNFIAQSTAPDATNAAGAVDAAGAKTAAANSGATVNKVVSTVSLGGMMLLKLLGNLLLIPMVLFYLLVDWARILDRAIELVPLPLRKSFIGFCIEADEVLGQYLRGQLSVVLTMAGFYSIGLLLFGLNLAIPVGVFTGLAMAVPYVGFAVGLFLAMIAGVLQFGIAKTAIMAIVYGAGQLLESFYLTPRWVGERIGLHPVTVIFALIAFGELFGFVGLLIALPVSAVLFVAAQQLRLRYFASSLFTGKKTEG